MLCTDDRYQRLPQSAVPSALHTCLKFGPRAKSSTSAEDLVSKLFRAGSGRFRHDAAIASKLQDKVLLLHKAKKVRSVTAAVAVREAKGKHRHATHIAFCSPQLCFAPMSRVHMSCQLWFVMCCCKLQHAFGSHCEGCDSIAASDDNYIY